MFAKWFFTVKFNLPKPHKSQLNMRSLIWYIIREHQILPQTCCWFHIYLAVSYINCKTPVYQIGKSPFTKCPFVLVSFYHLVSFGSFFFYCCSEVHATVNDTASSDAPINVTESVSDLDTEMKSLQIDPDSHILIEPLRRAQVTQKWIRILTARLQPLRWAQVTQMAKRSEIPVLDSKRETVLVSSS